MKRSNKLSLKSETVRQLTPTDLTLVNGGALTGDCRNGGGAEGDSGTRTTNYEKPQQQYEYQYNYQYGP